MNSINDFEMIDYYPMADKCLCKYRGSDESVVIPDGTTMISEHAFSDCNNVTSITIPDGVKTIGDYAFSGCSNLTNINIPESVTSIGCKAFSGCIGLKDKNGFVIVNNILLAYLGEGEDITIPYGVTAIGDHVFEDCNKLTSVIIPDSVTSIGMNAFYNCSSLKSIAIPNSVTLIRLYAFYDCKSLTSVTIPEKIKGIYSNTFYGCSSLTSVVIPDGVQSIGNYAFAACHSLTSINIPKSVRFFGDYVFCGCKNLTQFSARFKGSRFGNTMFGSLPKGLISSVGDWYIRFTDEDLIDCVLDESVWSKLDFGLQVEIFMNRHGEKLLMTYMKLIDNPDKFGQAILAEISEDISIEDCDAVACFLSSFGEAINSDEIVQKLYNALKSSKDGKKLLKDIEKNPILKARFSADKTVLVNDYEQIVTDILKSEKNSIPLISDALKKYYNLKLTGLPELKFLDGTKAPEHVLAYLLIVHSKMADNADDGVVNAYENSNVCKNAQKMLEILDSKSLQKALSDLVDDNVANKTASKKMYLVYPICRYADDNIINKIIKLAPKWRSNSSNKEAPQLSVFRKAYLYSPCKAAILLADKYGDLDEYARIRNTDAQTIRDTALIDFGFDATGKKEYDLGGTTIVVTLDKELTPSLFDTKNNKIVNSIPKRGNKESLINAATKDFDDLKSNIENVIKNRHDQLYSDFLKGREENAKKWKKVYIDNPILRTIANIVVWQQGNNTFILKDDKPIYADGSPYTITDAAILVAHPMEMTQKDISEWKAYFINNSLEQPFEQICEPVINCEEVNEDRYADKSFPYFCFQNKEKDGIFVKKRWDFISRNYFEITVNITFAECDFDIKYKDCYLSNTNNFEIKKFLYKKYTRQVNHIVAYLDDASIYDRIIKDDVTIEQYLKNPTAKQLNTYIWLSLQHDSKNVNEILIKYKNEHFSKSESNSD